MLGFVGKHWAVGINEEQQRDVCEPYGDNTHDGSKVLIHNSSELEQHASCLTTYRVSVAFNRRSHSLDGPPSHTIVLITVMNSTFRNTIRTLKRTRTSSFSFSSSSVP